MKKIVLLVAAFLPSMTLAQSLLIENVRIFNGVDPELIIGARVVQGAGSALMTATAFLKGSFYSFNTSPDVALSWARAMKLSSRRRRPDSLTWRAS